MKRKILFLIVFLVTGLHLTSCLTGANDSQTEQFTITFLTNSGTGVTALTVDKGKTIEEPITTKDNFTLLGWFTDIAFTNRFDFTTTITSSLNLHASWYQTFTVTFHTNGGSAIESQTVTAGSTITELSTTKAGFTLLGWYTENTFHNLYDFSKSIQYNLNLYAHWDEVAYISSIEDLQNIKNNMSGNYVLKSDIDLAGIEWTPIDDLWDEFTGTLEGNGFAISNLTITSETPPIIGSDYVGLFGLTKDATILNYLKKNI